MPNVFDEIEAEDAPKKNVFDEIEAESEQPQIAGVTGTPRLQPNPGTIALPGIDDSIPEVGFSPRAFAGQKESVSDLARSAADAFVLDPLVSLSKGVVGVPAAATGLADIATGGGAGKILEDLTGYSPKETNKFLDELYSDEQKEASRKVQDAEGFSGTARAMLENPTTILNSVVESVPVMLAGGAASKGLSAIPAIAKLGNLGKIAAGAAGEGVAGAGSTATQAREESDSGLITAGQAGLSLASGLTTSALSLLGGKVSEKLGIKDIDSVMAGVRSPGAKSEMAKRIIGGFVSEGGLEELPQSATEQIYNNLISGKPWSEGVSEASAQGLLVGGVTGSAANIKGGDTKVEKSDNQKTMDSIAKDFNNRPRKEAPKESMDFARSVVEMPADEFRKVGQSFNKQNIDLGLNASDEQLEELKQLRDKAKARADAAVASNPKTDEEIQRATTELMMPQFYNEAIKVAETLREANIDFDQPVFDPTGKKQLLQFTFKDESGNRQGSFSMDRSELVDISKIKEKAEAVRKSFRSDESLSVNPGGSQENLPADKQAISKANNSVKSFAEANGVEYVEGDTGATIFAKINAKKNTPQESLSSKSVKTWEIAEPISRESVRDAVSKFQSDFPAALPVVVVNSYQELPDSLHQTAYRQGANPAGISGGVSEGKVYIVADSYSSLEEVNQILLHEQAGHFATDKILGKRLNQFMQQVHDSFSDSELMADTRNRYKSADDVRLGREFVARLSENPQLDPGAWNKIVAMFRQFLRDIGWVKTVSENDIKVLLNGAMQSLSKIESGGDVETSLSVSGDRKETQGKFFTGQYTPTDRATQNLDAVAFIGDKTDEQVLDDISAFAGGKAIQGLSQENISATIAATMKRIFSRIGAAKNPVKISELWNLMDRAKSLAQQEGSVIAQTLEARKVYGEELGFMSPVLAFRGLAQKAWAKAFGLSDGQSVTQAFSGITEKSNSNAASDIKISELPISDSKVKQILNKAVADGGLNWADLFLNQSQATQAERRKHLLSEIRKNPLFQLLTPEQSLKLESALTKAWESARMSVFRKEFAKRVKLPTVEAAEKLFSKALPELIRQANLGTLNDSSFLDAFSKELGLPSLSGETATKLTKLAQEAQEKPEGVLRNKKLQEMIDVIQKSTPAHPLDIIRDYWYNNALSGTRTLATILTGSWIHGAIMAAQQAMDAAILKRRPGVGGRILQAFLSDSLEGIANGWDVFKTGDYTRRAEFAGNINRMLSGTGRLDSLEGWLKHGNLWQKALGLTSYVRRAVVGLDYVGAISTRGASVIYNALLDNPEQLEAALSRFDKEKTAQAKKQAKAELGDNAKWVDVRARQLEILESGISEQTKENATILGEIAALNSVPVGWGGVAYRLIEALPRAIQSGLGTNKEAANFGAFVGKTAAGLAFARAAINMTQSASNWMPLVGGVNYARALLGKKIPEGHWSRIFGVLDADGKPLSDDRRRLIVAAQLSGLSLAAIAYAMTHGGDGDDKDRFDISGSWYGLTPQQRKDKIESGERPLSIRVGGRWVNYANQPFAGALVMVGNMRDKERRDGKRMSPDEATTRMVDAWASGLFYIKDISVLSGLSRTLGVSAMNTDESASALNRLVAQQAGNAAGLIPFNSAVREIDTFFDPNTYKPSSGIDYWIRGIPFVRRTVGEGKEYNMAGLPVESMLTPQSRMIAPQARRDPVIAALSSMISRGIFPRHPGVDVTWIKDGEQKSAKDLPKETYEYQIQVLKEWREVMLVDAEYLKTVTPKEYDKYFNEYLAPVRDRVKKEFQQRIDPEALDTRGNIKKGYRQ